MFDSVPVLALVVFHVYLACRISGSGYHIVYLIYICYLVDKIHIMGKKCLSLSVSPHRVHMSFFHLG